MERRKSNLQDLLGQYSTTQQSSDNKQKKRTRDDLWKELIRLAKTTFKSFEKQWNVVLDDRTADEALSPNITLDEYAQEIASSVLNHLDERLQKSPTGIVAAKYVKQRINWRCRDKLPAILREHSIFWVTSQGRRIFISFGEMKEISERNLKQKEKPISAEDLEETDLPDPTAFTPEEILIAKENLEEKLRSVPLSKRGFPEMLEDICQENRLRRNFIDKYLIGSKESLAFFEMWEEETRADPQALEKALNARVLARYEKSSGKDLRVPDEREKVRQNFDTAKTRLRYKMARFLSSKDNH
jgi:hypothetical protein